MGHTIYISLDPAVAGLKANARDRVVGGDDQAGKSLSRFTRSCSRSFTP